jgi:Peptidase family M28
VSLRAAVERVSAAFDAARALERVQALAAFDRYQVSEGIERAADFVAAEAERAGLEDVSVTSYPGGSTWWTYAAPPAWTPRSARLELAAGGVLASYPETPCSLATFSRPTLARTVPLVTFGEGPVDGALAVVPLGLPPLSELEASGALGFVACASPVAVGRIELAPETRLVGFSVDRDALAAALAGAEAFVHTEVAATGSMPLVTGRLRGETSAEVLFLAHLCHPRPGANDNASGVAATLGLAETLRSLGPLGAELRFVWGPEFVGTAAYLHDVVGAGRAPLPRYVLNLDMVGEDQPRCGGPLVLERSPEHLSSALDAVAERAAAIVAMRAPAGWEWRSTAFLGASDHLLFADRAFGVPTLEVGHRPDRFNHTSADDVENVDPEELRRSATIAGASVLHLASSPLPEPRPSRGGARAWEGPFNLRAALADAPEADRRWFQGELAVDRLGAYARAVGLALRIDGDAPAAEDPFEARFLELLRRAGWL